MKKLRICIDMDDTIEYLLPAWLRWLNNQYNFNITPEMVNSWDITKYFPHLTMDQICEPLHIPEFWDTVRPMSDAIEYIDKLIKDGHKVYICTSTDYRIAPEKFNRCLFKHFPYIEWKNVIIARKKQLIHCNILIDDAMHNIVGPYKGFLKATIHNLDFKPEDYPTVTKVYCWKHIYEEIHKLYD